jgi:hypothetical protein
MTKILTLLLFWCLLMFFPKPVLADLNSVSCTNRYVTLVNPVRGRELWSDRSMGPLINQYLASAKYGMPATWLLQYDALTDAELAETVKTFETGGEKGLFLEVSKNMSVSAGVDYQNEVKWSSPGNAFLSAYSRSDRKRLIDTVYGQFKSVFGYYPKSVGAWWIDSYSLKYIKEKYGLDGVLIVADQKTTDSYGVWGQWWGYPYIPSIRNVLVPAKGRGLEAVVIQWAQRDPVLAYGGDYLYSNFSLQANDYIRSGKKTGYFEDVAGTYLDCRNQIGQITVGLETGMEAVEFHNEYENQLKLLSGNKRLQFVTMSYLSEQYLKVNRGNPENAQIGGFKMDTDTRTNEMLGDKVVYNRNIAFSDYFVADKSDFLDRELPVKDVQKSGRSNIILYLVVVVMAGLSVIRRKFNIWLATLFFVAASFGLIFRSGRFYGWEVYYGPALPNLYLAQLLIYLVSFVSVWFLIKRFNKKIKDVNLFLATLPLSFGIDGILSILRFSKLSGQNFCGILAGSERVAGVTLESFNIQFIYKYIPYGSLKHFFSFPFDKIFSNSGLYLFVYPLVHVMLAILVYFLILKMNTKVRAAALIILGVFYIVFINIVFNIDPVAVFPVTN